MVELLQLLLLAVTLAMSLAGLGFREHSTIAARARSIATMPRLIILGIACASFLGCLAVAGVLHEPVPRTHDEFSYLLLTT